MGNTTTKEKADHIDGGALLPHGVYSGPQDYDFRIVQRLIFQRRIAPFYKGLDDWDDSEDAQEEKERQSRTAAAASVSTNPSVAGTGHHHSPSTTSLSRAAGNLTEQERDMKRLYQGAIECPICFLYYPRNINRTRCCDKPMCTECFVQLKRLESAPTESPACPYCVEPHFGVIYSPALLPGGHASSPASPAPGPTAIGGTSMSVSSSSNSIERGPETQSPSSPSTRRRSTSHKSPEVVTADELRPDWNRRILAAVQRQPGSRRASTSSSMNATFALGRRLAVGRQAGSSSRRSNSSTTPSDYNGYLTAMRNMGTDLEELMIMEAMRQSLQDEHDRQTREAAAVAAATAATTAATSAASPLATTTTATTAAASSSNSNADNHRHSASGQDGRSRSALSSLGAPTSMSSSSSLSRAARGHAMNSRTRSEDSSSLTSTSDHGAQEDSESDSDEDGPELLHNRAIRFAAVPIPTSTSVETDLPKHRPQEEGPTHSSEVV
ncbi:SNF1-interacting protein [Dissophora globulifera]|uniref:SNF1-interacting protein n=1 Tax=Dissophora globulifera TaxID=979702 RepID=A0A9P6URM6_9FUNG|nr:SNF1-interacting protein [Dissophora globulifera]